MTKESFLMYRSFYKPLQKLSDTDKGQLFEAIFQYQIDSTRRDLSPAAEMAFDFIREVLDRDKEKYLNVCQKNKENIKKRWNKNDTTVFEPIRPNTKHTDNDNDNDNTICRKSGDVPSACYEIIELITAFCAKHNRTYSCSKEKAAKVIKAMQTIDGVEYAAIKEAFEKYAAFYTGAQYEPEIFSARALREKWNNLKGFISRLDSKAVLNTGRPTGAVV